MVVHHILVPPDIVAVPRRSPVPVRKRTPWHPEPDGTVRTDRAGGRDWFSDKVFVEAQHGHERSGYGTSVTVHSIAAAAVIAIILTRPVTILRVGDGSGPLVMPASLSLVPVAPPSVEASAVKPAAVKPNPQPVVAAPASAGGASAPAPVEAPSSIEPETGAETHRDGAEGGVDGGIPGGVVGGTGLEPAAGGDAPMGPVRVGGGGLKPPRKIKDVKPVYPQGVLASQIRGTVVVDLTIGVDGTVQSAKVVHSVPLLDQAALDAVRQWEYTPSLLDGRPVSVVLTVILNFTIQ